MASQRSAEERAMKAKRAARILQCSKGAREARPTLIRYEDWLNGVYYSKANELIPKMLELGWNKTYNYYYPAEDDITFSDCYGPDDDADVVIDPLTIDEVLRHEIVPALIAGGHIEREEWFWRPWLKKLVERLSMPLSKMPPQVSECIRSLDFYISFLERLNALRLRKKKAIMEHPLQRSSSSSRGGSGSESGLVSSPLAMGGGGENPRVTRARAVPVVARGGSRDRASGGAIVINLCDEESDAEDNQRTDPAPQPCAASLKAGPTPRRQDDTPVSGSSGGGEAKAQAKRAPPARPSSSGKTPARTSQGQASGGGGAGAEEEGKARSSARPSSSSVSSPQPSQGRKRASQGGAAAEPVAKQPRGAPASSSQQGGGAAPQHQRGESSRQQQGGGGGEVAAAAPVGAPAHSVVDAVGLMTKHIINTLYHNPEWNQEHRQVVRARVRKAFAYQHDLVFAILKEVYGDGSMGVERAAADALTSLVSFAEFNGL